MGGTVIYAHTGRHNADKYEQITSSFTDAQVSRNFISVQIQTILENPSLVPVSAVFPASATYQ